MNVEICHIYIDQPFGEEQKKSIMKYRSIQNILPNHTIGILVDDYNASSKNWSLSGFLQALSTERINPDFIISERSLAKYYTTLATFLKKKFRSELDKYIQKKDGYVPCSTIVAIWHLVRLGIIQTDDDIFLLKGSANYTASELMSILPKKYAPTEKKAQKVILNSSLASILSRIHYIFY